MKPLGLYLHIPFCRSKCHYCDFCSLPHPTDGRMAAYAVRLCDDLAARAESLRDYTVDSVYLGGGTPTLLPPAALVSILETVAKHCHLSPDAEITAECNPATGSYEGFLAMRRAGCNRLSMGVQSTQTNELRALGRIHTFRDVKETWEAARSAGFENMSADVMQGIPEQTVASYLSTLSDVLTLSPTHVSAYGLSIEEGTRFYQKRDVLPLPDEEAERQMYFAGSELLASHGILQYEISNFARAGYESRHNLKYWRCEEYLGFGPAAYSCMGGVRFGNSRDVDAYLDGEEILWETETLSKKDLENEYVMLGLRLTEGISRRVFFDRFGERLDAFLGDRLTPYLAACLARETAEGYALTREGMYLSNAILSDVLDL